MSIFISRLFPTWQIFVLLYSESILDPEVPQALRLQAILTSGIVLLHKKKVNYLKEDAEHTMVSAYEGLFKFRCQGMMWNVHAEKTVRSR